jgi:N-acetylneuraminic acid mutarotase
MKRLSTLVLILALSILLAACGSGGARLNTVEEYDPVTNTWTTMANMPTPRFGLAAVAVNGKIYAIGGWAGSAGSYTDLAKVEEYTP